MADRLPLRITQRITIARPPGDVFDFLRSPENPELDALRIDRSLSKNQTLDVAEDPDPDAVRWSLRVIEYKPPARLKWRTEYRSGDMVIPGACEYALAAKDGGTLVTQTYERPWPSLPYRPFIPLLWWKARSGMRRRLQWTKETLEA